MIKLIGGPLNGVCLPSLLGVAGIICIRVSEGYVTYVLTDEGWCYADGHHKSYTPGPVPSLN